MRRRALVAIVAWAAMARRGRAAEPPARREPLVLVVGKGCKVDDLTAAQVRALFLGDSVRGPGGTKLIPLNQPPLSQDRVAFDRLALKMSPEQVGRYWTDRRIRGEGAPPRAVAQVSILKRAVAQYDGMIGYVRRGELDDAVKLVAIDGRRPDDPGYLLAE